MFSFGYCFRFSLTVRSYSTPVHKIEDTLFRIIEDEDEYERWAGSISMGFPPGATEPLSDHSVHISTSSVMMSPSSQTKAIPPSRSAAPVSLWRINSIPFIEPMIVVPLTSRLN